MQTWTRTCRPGNRVAWMQVGDKRSRQREILALAAHRKGSTEASSCPASSRSGRLLAAQDAGDLDSVITRMQGILSADGRSTSAAQATYFMDKFIPALDASKDVVKQEYRHEYGNTLFGGPGCQCFCGKCHLSQDLPFTEMRAFLYTGDSGESEVILTCSEEQAARLERNGATQIRWTAFGRAHTADNIDEKCPPLRDEVQGEEEDAPEWLADLSELPSQADFAKYGLPRFHDIKDGKSWSGVFGQHSKLWR